MWISLIGILIGIILGMILPFNIPTAYSSYISIAVLAALDSVFGGIRSSLEKNFEADVFISGFFGNSILAAGLAYIGDRLDVPIYLGAIFVFGYRLFDNFALIRRHILGYLRKKSYLEDTSGK
ncbi:MAG: small basic family protein [Caldicoprobacterales bacterium]|jgi:small basic protein|nr:small basic family protein [Clostridiales bacterium]